MQSYILYGLGRDNAVLATEKLSVSGAEEARKIASERLGRFAKVELWSASVCVFRRVRAEAGP